MCALLVPKEREALNNVTFLDQHILYSRYVLYKRVLPIYEMRDTTSYSMYIECAVHLLMSTCSLMMHRFQLNYLVLMLERYPSRKCFDGRTISESEMNHRMFVKASASYSPIMDGSFG